MNEEELNAYIDYRISLAQKGAGSKPKGADIPFLESLWGWLNNRNKIAITTRARYEWAIKDHIEPYFTQDGTPLTLADIDRDRVQIFANSLIEKGLSPKSIRAIICEVLSQFFRLMYDDGKVERNPVKRVEIPKTQGSKRPAYTVEQVKTLLDFIPQNDPWRIAIILLAFLGLRRGEMLGLCWDMVDLGSDPKIYVERTNVAIPKEKTRITNGVKTEAGRRCIPLPFYVADELRKHKQTQKAGTQTVITQRCRKDAPVAPNNFSRKLRKWVKDAGLPPLSAHCFRHFAVTMAIKSGIPEYIILKIFGWTDARMLRTYADDPQLFAEQRKGMDAMGDNISKGVISA